MAVTPILHAQSTDIFNYCQSALPASEFGVIILDERKYGRKSLFRMLNPNRFFELKYFLHFFNSSVCIGYMFDKQVDNARANLSMTNISQFAISIPPKNEQKRIVAKVDELMAFCDELENSLSQSQTDCDKLIEAAVAEILAA